MLGVIDKPDEKEMKNAAQRAVTAFCSLYTVEKK